MITPVNRKNLYQAISKTYGAGTELTARECAVRLKKKGYCMYGIRQETQPRIVELVKMGVLETSGSKIDKVTRKKVTIYRKKADYEEM